MTEANRKRMDEDLGKWSREIAMPAMIKAKAGMDKAVRLIGKNAGTPRRVLDVKLPWWRRIWRRR